MATKELACDLNGAWLDFYALLGVSSDVNADELRRCIGASYAEATQNCDHRDLQRRMFYQAMVERVLPQCRRVLLNPETRARYDAQHALHEADSPDALPYVAFMAGLMSGVTAPQAPSEENSQAQAPAAEAGNEVAPVTAESEEEGWAELDFSALPQRVQDEIAIAREILQTLEDGCAFELLPSRAVTNTLLPSRRSDSDAPQPSEPVAPQAVAAEPVEAKQQQETATHVEPKPSIVVPLQAVDNAVPMIEAPEAQRPFKRASWDSDEKLPRQRPEIEQVVGVTDERGLMQDDITFDAEKSRARRQEARRVQREAYKSRFSLDEDAPAFDSRNVTAQAKPSGRNRLLSETGRLLLTAIAATCLMVTIQNDNSAPVQAGGNRVAPASQPLSQTARKPVSRPLAPAARTRPVKIVKVAPKKRPKLTPRVVIRPVAEPQQMVSTIPGEVRSVR